MDQTRVRGYGRAIGQIMAVFDSKAHEDHFAQSVPYEQIAANDYNLSVSSYVEAQDTREKIDITVLNAELLTTVANIESSHDSRSIDMDLPRRPWTTRK